jgi:flagellar basal-body rod modification protein FlgD
VTILNQAGRVVRSLVAGEARGSGVHSEMWDGRDDAGRALPSGEYRIEIKAVAADGSVGRASARAVR